MTKQSPLPPPPEQRAGESDAFHFLRQAVYCAGITQRLLDAAVELTTQGALRGWAEDAPLDEERLDNINQAHGSIPGHKREG